MLWNAKNGQVPLGGSAMSYVSFGRGGKTLVILPGLSDGLATVKGKALLLAPPYQRFFDRYTIYLFSRRDDLPQGFTIRDMAEDQARALAALGVEKAAVLGVSQGGMIAQALAVGHPGLVEKLVLAVTAPRVSPLSRERVEGWIALAERGDHKQLMIDTAENSYSPAYLKKYRKLYPVIGAVGKPADYGRFLANAKAILAFDITDGLERITCPTLILGGTDDRIVGMEASCELYERIAGSELFLYEGLGHAAYEEAADFNDRVFRFLES
ncbi:MAG: alpha/beta hydrolase [Oscillospiraceae bacterium]|nr:alpha/beta hydrolase [Oscillospiraceae bacterium]